MSTVTGWGARAEGGATAHILQELAGLQVLSDDQCRGRLGSSAISSDMLCAGGRKGEDACQAEINTDQIREMKRQEIKTWQFIFLELILCPVLVCEEAFTLRNHPTLVMDVGV